MSIPSVPVRPGQATQAKISWFGGPHDPSAGGTPASGIPITTPGIATYNRATLGGYFLVTAPNGRQAVLRQTDLGPSPSTGRGIDFTYSSLPLLGYNESNFPTDATAKATYLGRTVPPQYQHLAGHYQASAAPPSPQASQATTSTTTQQFNQAGFRQAQQRYTLGQFLKQSDRGSLDGPGVPGLPSPSSALEPLFKLGAIPTTAPNPQDYLSAHTVLQKVAGGTPLRTHPAVAQAMSATRFPTGVGTFGGKPVAKWIIPILSYARAHGWSGSVNSGYRSFADQKWIYDSGVRPAAVPGTSNHEGDQFPRGAVDVSNAQQLSAILQRSPYASVLVWAGGKDPVHFSHPHNGSY